MKCGKQAGFRVLDLRPSGGFFSFLQLIVATFFVGITYGVPVLWPATFALLRASNRLVLWLDDVTDKRKLFALHYVAVAERP